MTQKELAKKLKISQKTISRVLNGESNVQGVTRERVLAAIRRYNYQVNTNASNLVTGRKGNIGIILHVDTLIDSPLFKAILPHVNSLLQHRNHTVTLFTFESSSDIESLLKTAMAKTDGLIIFESVTLHEHINAIEHILIENNFSNCVKLHGAQAKSLFPAIGLDNRRAGEMAAGHLIDCGCKNLLYWGSPKKSQTEDHERCRGFAEICKLHGIECGIVRSKITEIKDMLAREKTDFDGIFAWSDTWARALIYELQLTGREIPRDVRIVGFDNYKPMVFMSHPYLSSIEQNHEQLACQAVKMLFREIDSDDDIDIEAALIVRESSK